MEINEKIKDICTEAIKGAVSPDEFYDKLSAIADDTRTDGDIVCIIEDVLMEMEMEHGGASKKVMRKIMCEMAENLIKQING